MTSRSFELLSGVVPVASTSLGKTAVRVCDRAMGEGKITSSPSPVDIFALLLQLLQLLQSQSCYPTPESSTRYINSQRPWRVRRIGREIRRGMTAFPKYGKDVVESIVRSILEECRVCSVGQMREYYRVVEGFRDY